MLASLTLVIAVQIYVRLCLHRIHVAREGWMWKNCRADRKRCRLYWGRLYGALQYASIAKIRSDVFGGSKKEVTTNDRRTKNISNPHTDTHTHTNLMKKEKETKQNMFPIGNMSNEGKQYILDNIIHGIYRCIEEYERFVPFGMKTIIHSDRWILICVWLKVFLFVVVPRIRIEYNNM